MRTVRNPRRVHDVEPVRVSFSEPAKTRQSFKAECDVNKIVDTYARTGLVPNQPRTPPQYADCPDTTLYEAACVQAEIRSSEEESILYPAPEPLRGSQSDEVDSDGVEPDPDQDNRPEGDSGAAPDEQGGSTDI